MSSYKTVAQEKKIPARNLLEKLKLCDNIPNQLVLARNQAASTTLNYLGCPGSSCCLGRHYHPNLTVLTDETPVSIPTARWTNASSNLWNNNNWNTYQIQGDPRVYSELGIFSCAYHSDRFSYFVNDGSTAINTTESPQRFPKSDNSNFTYYGRSYGMDAAVGLNDSFTLNPYIRSYDYNDTGCLSQYTCDYDTTFAIQLDLTTSSPVPVY
ncbi:uncharacterized protein P174DRAFT_435026 [Aspergillus novofumigatus IBT 16806]|uniref:Uncharacterized protein n=1 Tax=Aspergillus novofumigatus (strain IBT 16806) TaxID=1392255 RepID=A0A2I1BWH6_ASPN1|nr:uncharacterized protein P174DRAFT_435026 [Aspergillus novofumigatus IBT 16806]PKX89651.1 hypothetical protein P174DRAFT_435026 [Aspergillus novofumigatus IBT 16806]